MHYALLIYGPEGFLDRASQADLDAEDRRYLAFGTRHASAIMAHVPLELSLAATTVRVRDGRRQISDGPHAILEEQLRRLYVIEAPDLDRALEMAATLPGAGAGTVEVRPLARPLVHPPGQAEAAKTD